MTFTNVLGILGSGTLLCLMMQKRYKIEVTKIYWAKKPFFIVIHNGFGYDQSSLNGFLIAFELKNWGLILHTALYVYVTY